MIRDLRRRHWELKSFKRRRRLVWRVPEPQETVSDDKKARSVILPTVSPRRWRWLGRREVYPHSLHVHMARIEKS